MVTRAGFLAGVGALAASGCGRAATEDEPGGAPPERSATSRRGDIELLQAALGVEEQQDSPHDRAHAERLRQALRDLGAEPVPTPSDVPVDDGRVIAFYLDLLPKLYTPQLRTLVASILVVEAQELAAASERPAPEAFVYGTQPS